MISTAIIEDVVVIAEELQELINNEDDMTCKWVYHNAEDALHFLPRHQVDIVLVDIGLPRASGIEVIRQLAGSDNETAFCMFTVYEDDDKIFESLQNGAKGYILKSAAADRIIESIRELHRGGAPMSPTIARRVIDVFQQQQLTITGHSSPRLTDRENELLGLLSEGLLYKEIAPEMGITLGTVKQHIHRIYEKLHVNNRTEAINKWRKE